MITARRPGDVAAVVADVSRIATTLEWSAHHNLDSIVRSSIAAWFSAQSPASRAHRERVAELA